MSDGFEASKNILGNDAVVCSFDFKSHAMHTFFFFNSVT